MAKIPILLDTDIGDDIDDALAVLLALRSPELELLGITTVHQNTKARAALVGRLLQIEKRDDIPVCWGSGQPIIERVDRDQSPCQFSDEKPFGRPGAAPFIAATIRSRPGAIRLVTIGPLTNVALALLQDESLAGQIAEIVMMAGSFYLHSNECNIASDPEAARIVFDAGIPIRAVGLDVTRGKTLTPAQEKQFFESPDPAVACIVAWLKRWRTILHHNETMGPGLHDPIAVMAAFDPGLIEYAREDVFIELAGAYTRGSTFLKNHAWGPQETEHVRVARHLHLDRFRNRFMQRIAAETPMEET